MDVRFKAVSDHGVLVGFGTVFSEDINQAVTRLDLAMKHHTPVGVLETVPAFVNLLVVFDPLQTDHEAVTRATKELLDVDFGVDTTTTPREVAVCYDDDLAPDLGVLSERTGMNRDTIINAHLAGDYRVVLYGFAPGYAYLTGVDEAIQEPRKKSAVRDVPAGTVLIAGSQCLVSTIIMPTGWWRIGRATTQILTDDTEHPFLFNVGDPVSFKRISRSEFNDQQSGGCGG